VLKDRLAQKEEAVLYGLPSKAKFESLKKEEYFLRDKMSNTITPKEQACISSLLAESCCN
jgi:hypothetical protein